ncbi:DUF1656 domain-containing protein [Paraburkholderia sartisoli]|uniref:DUF1656 domain-containing protein n=1 Tax=Paraburkholderia sartisoli TaxID=83784 RepID=A0A1H4CKP0_9BURK|nr:DUF1656 domain-containing protein [Paraburkholderia sartisoli]SEA60880.1 Protein of unknown function [Paraburkholderia sartisoli]
MFRDIDVVGVFVPALAGLMFIAGCIFVVLRRALARTGFYRIVWHRSLLDLGLYVMVLGAVVSVSRWIGR